MKFIYLITIFVFGCSSQQRTLAEVPKVEKAKAEKEEPALVTSVRATLDDSPDTTVTKIYKVKSDVNMRDFPSVKDGHIVGKLKKGQFVMGHEIEGSWIRVYDNKYTGVKFLEVVK